MQAYLGEIRVCAGYFAPTNWHLCDGSLLQISQNEDLFKQLGTTYGGDGRTTFALPDLRGRVAVGAGQGFRLGAYPLGQAGGVESVRLTSAQLPKHSHPLFASSLPGTTSAPANAVIAANAKGVEFEMSVDATGSVNAPLNANTLQSMGSCLPHENRMPCQALNFIICTNGIASRS